MKAPQGLRNLVLCLLAISTACASEGDRAAEGTSDGDVSAATPTSTETSALAVATELGVRNVRAPQPGLITAGQPTEEQLEALTNAGVTRVISLRVAEERGAGWEEAHAAAATYEFDRLPIAGADALTRENVEALAELLQEGGDGPTLLYCGSSNRVGALLALKAYWLDGASAEDAVSIGREAGMTRLEDAVREAMERDPAQ
jgi:protein tyrosine phosphatase (PTP) superfamily phosphohydrolase (DUF442 family)